MSTTRRLALAMLLIVSCSRSAKKAEPVASLSTSPHAAVEFQLLRERWASRSLDAKAIETFLSRHPKDGAAPLAKVYLAFVLIDRGQLVAADGVLGTVATVAPGTTRDLATIARARSLRLHGAPQ